MDKEKKKIYFVCRHPVACYFGEIVHNVHKRVFLSLFLGFVISLVSRIHPICSDDFCYTIFAQILLNPGLFLKPLSLDYIILPAFYTFVLFSLVWLGIFSLFSAMQKPGTFNEMILPAITIALFIYMMFLVSGTIGPFFIHTGLVECISDDECIRAGYVGEVCTSVYRPVYTKYSPDLQPLENCGCVNNKCVGS